MRKLIFAIIMAMIIFVLLNFIYCNLDAGTFGYLVKFKFVIPYLISLQSMPMPLGFVILLAFCSGMIAIAVFEALPSMFKTLQLRAKNKRIRELEREISVLRELSQRKEEESIDKMQQEMEKKTEAS